MRSIGWNSCWWTAELGLRKVFANDWKKRWVSNDWEVSNERLKSWSIVWTRDDGWSKRGGGHQRSHQRARQGNHRRHELFHPNERLIFVGKKRWSGRHSKSNSISRNSLHPVSHDIVCSLRRHLRLGSGLQRVHLVGGSQRETKKLNIDNRDSPQNDLKKWRPIELRINVLLLC